MVIKPFLAKTWLGKNVCQVKRSSLLKSPFIKIVIDYRGRHLWGITIYNATEDNLQKTFFLTNKNVLFEHCIKAKTINNINMGVLFPVSAGMILV